MNKIKDRDSCFPLVTGQKGPTNKWVSFHLHYGAQATYFSMVWDRQAPAVGPFFYDITGSMYLDFVSHVGSAPFGYNNPDMIDFLKDFKLMEPMRYAGTDYIAGCGKNMKCDFPTSSHLHHKLHKITKQIGLQKSFFTNSGAEAVENCVKLAYYNRKNRGYTVCFDGAFHGRTLGVLSFNRSKVVQKAFYPTLPNIISLPFCKCPGKCNCPWTKNGMSSLAYILDKIEGLYQPEEISAIVIEPVQGEGGYRAAGKGFMKDIYRIAKTHNIPFICDEVQAGMGRTGKWWSCEHFKVKPDLMSSAKALRIGATIGKKQFFPTDQGHIGSTFGEGNPLATAMGYKTIEIIRKRKLLKNAAQKGKYFLKQLRTLESKRSVVETRGIGLMLAIEFKTKKHRDKVIKNCHKKGLLVAGTGHKSIRFIPPLDVRKREIDLCISILEKAI